MANSSSHYNASVSFTPSTTSSSPQTGAASSILDAMDGLPGYDVPKEYSVLNPNPPGGSELFSTDCNEMEYHFFLRYAIHLLSLIDTDPGSYEHVKKHRFEGQFVLDAHRNSSLTYCLSSSVSMQGIWQGVMGGASAESNGCGLHPRAGPQGPHTTASVQNDLQFIFKMTQRCCFSLLTVMGGLEYIIRLKQRESIRFHRSTWRLLWVISMLISEKMWEDNFVHPQHIVSMFNCQVVSKKEFLLLQLFTLNRLQYDVNISEPRFGELLQDIMRRSVPSFILDILPVDQYAERGVFIPRPLPDPPRIVPKPWTPVKLPGGSALPSRLSGRMCRGMAAEQLCSNRSSGAATAVSRDDVRTFKRVNSSGGVGAQRHGKKGLPPPHHRQPSMM